jgi:hypothetical protein
VRAFNTHVSSGGSSGKEISFVLEEHAAFTN